MKEDLRRTPWNRLAVRLRVPATTGVYLVGAGAGLAPRDVLLVGSATNLRERLLELIDLDELEDLEAKAVHWVADLSLEQARIAERLFSRRYDPPLRTKIRSRYEDILAG